MDVQTGGSFPSAFTRVRAPGESGEIYSYNICSFRRFIVGITIPLKCIFAHFFFDNLLYLLFTAGGGHASHRRGTGASKAAGRGRPRRIVDIPSAMNFIDTLHPR